MERAKSRWKFYLPDELWPEILSRLPVKSLLRFRCVSRSWKIWIDDPNFSRLHLNRFNDRPNPPILVVQGSSDTQLECVVKNSETLITLFRFRFPQAKLVEANHYIYYIFDSVRRWSIISSIDGLFLIRWKHKPLLMLWNASTCKTLALPPLPEIPSHQPIASQIFDFGLAFDPVIRDYKVVRMIQVRKKELQYAAVYTLGTNSWKLIECLPKNGACLILSHSPLYVSVNGVIYGFAHLLIFQKLVTFDLRSEVFSYFELDVPETMHNTFDLTTIDDGRSLALVQVCEFKGYIWTLEKLGDDTGEVSWIKRYVFDTVHPDDLRYYKFLCIKKNGEMLVQWCNMVISYNLETQKQKVLIMEGNTKSFVKGNIMTYMESLLLHSKAN